MKSVMLSIRPKYCELIASGKKNIEIRKTRPKLDPPFKCYIYCTKGNINDPWQRLETHSNGMAYLCNGMVMGEFVCDKTHIITFFYGGIKEDLEYELCGSCLTPDEARKYFATKTNRASDPALYGWHISDLVIYDRPRELGEFVSGSSRLNYSDTADGFPWRWSGMTRPPRSWGYVEEATK